MKIVAIVLGIIILLITLSLFFGLNKISGKSMEPNLKDQTTVVTRRLFLINPSLERGSIVIYKKDATGPVYVGRIVALPKESVMFGKGNLYIKNNSQNYKVEESYLSEGTKTYANTVDGDSADWLSIGEFSYLVLPDKRDNRIDLSDNLINKNNIESVILFPLQ